MAEPSQYRPRDVHLATTPWAMSWPTTLAPLMTGSILLLTLITPLVTAATLNLDTEPSWDTTKKDTIPG